VELSPLAPGHAYNRTDARIAHMNTFLNLFKAKSRVFGAKGIAQIFYAAAAYSMKNKRNYMARSHIYYRVVSIDRAKADAEAALLGSVLQSDDLDKGRMGVRGLLYFDFSVLDMDGEKVYTPGYARVREYPDPAKPGNRSRVYTWRKDYAALMCQPCSDAQGGPVALLLSRCTKKKCSIVMKRKQAAAEQAAARVQQSMPLHGDLDSDIEEDDGSGDEAESQHRNKERAPQQQEVEQYEQQELTQETREVRAVHGRKLDGPEELWFYVPYHKKDESNTKRKGWWLYPQTGAPGLYYIGPLDNVQQTKQSLITDVARFKHFPFDCSVQINQNTGKPRPTTKLCVTSRKLTEQELYEARDGKDIDEPTGEDSVVNEETPAPENMPNPKSRPKKKQAKAAAPSRRSSSRAKP
jgi:hypothetical protein